MTPSAKGASRNCRRSARTSSRARGGSSPAYAFQDKLTPKCEFAVYDSVNQLDKTLSTLNYAIGECKDDLKKNCAEIKPGEGRLLDCLNKNEAKVSARCNAALKDTGLKK